MLYVSLSAEQDYSSCERLYYNKYVLRLVPRREHIAPLRGNMLHRYLELYYSIAKAWDLRPGGDPGRAHRLALACALSEYSDQINGILVAAAATQQFELINEYKWLADAVAYMAERYHVRRGYSDWYTYKILLVEQAVRNIMIAPGIRSNGKVDLVIQHRETGRVAIVEHKTTENVPPEKVRLKDLQTMLYRAKLRWLLKYGPKRERGLYDFPDPQEVIWNYIWTKTPTRGDNLFNKPTKDYPMGPPSKDKRIVTTWYAWSTSMIERGLDPDAPEWSAIKEHLTQPDCELTRFFPRYLKTMVVAPRVLLHDYIQTATDIKRKRKSWSQTTSSPRFTGVYTRKCNYCSYEPLCMSLLTGADERDVIANALDTDYKIREEHHG